MVDGIFGTIPTVGKLWSKSFLFPLEPLLGVKLLMGLNSIDADLKGPDDITNPFDFDK